MTGAWWTIKTERFLWGTIEYWTASFTGFSKKTVAKAQAENESNLL